MNHELQFHIQIETSYLDKYSQPEYQRFAFAYTITIQNNSTIDSQLLSRHWVITDAAENKQEVHGNGVVGAQPVIPVGEEYTYSSHAVIATHVGTMEGSYTMRALDNSIFEVPIPIFSLVKPDTLH